MDKSTRVVAEDVDAPVLVSRGSETPIVAQRNAQPETAFCLVLAYPRETLRGVQTPHVNLAVDAAACEILAVGTQCNGPDLAGLVLVYNLAILTPHAVFALTPYFDFAFEAGAGCAAGGGFFGGYEVVDAQWMGLVEGLNEREVGLRCVVDIYGGGARG